LELDFINHTCGRKTTNPGAQEHERMKRKTQVKLEPLKGSPDMDELETNKTTFPVGWSSVWALDLSVIKKKYFPGHLGSSVG